MKRNTLKKIAMTALLFPLLLSGCGSNKQPEKKEPAFASVSDKIQIGMSFDTFVLERWIRDLNVFESTATDLGAEVNVQNANSDAEVQVSQVEYLIDKDVDVLVIIAVDGKDEKLHEAIARAQSKGIKIIAYDRSIDSMNVDLLTSFDNEKVGSLMAEAVISQIPDNGSVVMLLGSPSDNNVTQVEKGAMDVLNAHHIEPIYKNYADNWKAEYAYEQMSECIDQFGAVDGVICGNDGLAAMTFKALSEHRMVDDVCLVGQDADIDACQRIVEGTQYMTVYKSIDQLAKQTAQYAVQLANGTEINLPDTFFDGKYEVPFLKLEPVAITSENIDKEIIDSHFHLRSEVYLNVDAQ